MSQSAIRYSIVDSPVGPLLVAMDRNALIRLEYTFTGRDLRPDPAWVRDDAALGEVRRQIVEWFAGDRTVFEFELSYRGNPFQRAVWEAMRRIPYGETRTYGEIAREIGEGPAAARAVGSACGDNPLPLVIPCHRVVGAGGTLTGFSHGAPGGLDVKRQLLDHEFRIRPPKDTLFALL